MKTRDAICQHVVMRLQVSRRRADVQPVGSLRNMRKKCVAFFQQIGKQTVFERMIHAEIRSIPELLFNFFRLIRKRKRDVGNARATQRVELVKQKRFVTNWDDRFWGVNGQWTQPCAFSTSQD